MEQNSTFSQVHWTSTFLTCTQSTTIEQLTTNQVNCQMRNPHSFHNPQVKKTNRPNSSDLTLKVLNRRSQMAGVDVLKSFGSNTLLLPQLFSKSIILKAKRLLLKTTTGESGDSSGSTWISRWKDNRRPAGSGTCLQPADPTKN